MLIGWAAMLIFALHTCTHMVGAGDTWVSMACGRHFINHGVSTVEPFSANSHRPGPTPEEVKTWPDWAQKITGVVSLDTVKYWHPTGWVNQNWLTHVMFYWLTHLSPFADAKDLSFNTLVYWKFAIYILLVICVYYTGRVLGAHPALCAAFACAALFIGRSFIDIRPAGFSNLLVAAFMLILALATYRNFLYIWLIVPMTIFWANVHGGYIYVFIMLVPLVVLRFLTMLSKRTTLSTHCVLTWLALYAAMFKFTSHEPFSPVSPSQDGFLILIVLLIVASIVLAQLKSKVEAPLFYGYHFVASVIVFGALFARLFPPATASFSPDAADYVNNSQVSFFLAFLAAIGLGIVVTLLKDRLILTPPAAVWHTIAAGFAAFVGSIVFNPFHLTNLTHTFQISISPNAEGWRNVHEWWAAFRWDNPVGTAFPFLVMLIAGCGLLVLWILGRVLAPRILKGPKADMERQQKRFNILAKIVGFGATVMVCWTVLVSFSLTDEGFAGFLLSVIFAGILWASVFISVHFIYLIALLAIVALYSSEPAAGYLARYIFPFVLIPGYVLMYIIGSQISKKVKFSIINIAFVSGAAIFSVILTSILINPFNFKQGIWHLGQFWGVHRLWQPAYEANTELTYENLFKVIYIINGLCIAVWLLAPYIKAELEEWLRQQQGQRGPISAGEGEGYQLPRIDLALITIAAMTAYMAVRSRRFIPIAGYAACPVIAMITDQLIQTASAAWNFYKRGRYSVPRMPRVIQWAVIIIAIAVTGGLGGVWGWKFKKVYLDPWPSEDKLTSVFIRMTASAVKPFDACAFMRANHLEGNMFNYWTEGGFIGWGQEPDPNTGKTPLQLFMDGRAQAAYNYDAYIRWSEIMFGGETVQRARVRRQNLTNEDYIEIGKWIDGQLRQSKVWVVLMPANQFDTPFVTGLEHTANWLLVFLNDKQRMYVDVTTPKGLALFKGIEDGSTKYPEEYVRDIMIANNALSFGNNRPEILERGLNSALKAMEASNMRAPMQMIQTFYERYPQCRPEIDAFWKKMLDDFTANQKEYLSHDGYYNKIVGALMAIQNLAPIAQQNKNGELLESYIKKRDELLRVVPDVKEMRW